MFATLVATYFFNKISWNQAFIHQRNELLNKRVLQ